MSESGLVSEEEEEERGSISSGSSEDDADFDNSYDYADKDDDEDEYSDDDEESVLDDHEDGVLVTREPREDDWQYCEQGIPPRRQEPPQVYAPDRGPPLLDFMFVLTAFCAAVFAAYYTIFNEQDFS